LLREGLLTSLERPEPYRALLTGHRGSGKSFDWSNECCRAWRSRMNC
jgi:hypothetical protein